MKPSEFNAAVARKEMFKIGNMICFTKNVVTTAPKQDWDKHAMTAADTIKELQNRIAAPWLYALAFSAVEKHGLTHRSCQVIIGDVNTLQPTKIDLDRECYLRISPCSPNDNEIEQFPLITHEDLKNIEFLKKTELPIYHNPRSGYVGSRFRIEAIVNGVKQIFNAGFEWGSPTLD